MGAIYPVFIVRYLNSRQTWRLRKSLDLPFISRAVLHVNKAVVRYRTYSYTLAYSIQTELQFQGLMYISKQQCCGSMSFWGGSGSFYFRHWPSRCQQKNNFFNTIFSAYDFLKLDLHRFSKIKIQKESQNRRNQGFSYYFCMMIEESGSRSGSGSGSIPLTSGSGSGSWRPKNMWIRIRIRIRNTAKQCSGSDGIQDCLWHTWSVSIVGILSRCGFFYLPWKHRRFSEIDYI